MGYMKRRKLNKAEAARFRKYCDEQGGQQIAATALFTSTRRISNLITGKHVPHRSFMMRLIELRIMDED